MQSNNYLLATEARVYSSTALGRQVISKALESAGENLDTNDGLESWIYAEPCDWPQHLRTLEWRLDMQVVVFEAFASLVRRGLVDISGLAAKFTVGLCVGSEVERVSRALLSSEHNQQLERPPFQPQFDIGSYLAPMQWLATLIVRGTITNDFEKIRRHLAAQGFLGEIYEDGWREWWPLDRILRRQSDAGSTMPTGLGDEYKTGSLGFVLPTVVGEAMTLEEVEAEFFNDVADRSAPIEEVLRPNAGCADQRRGFGWSSEKS